MMNILPTLCDKIMNTTCNSEQIPPFKKKLIHFEKTSFYQNLFIEFLIY